MSLHNDNFKRHKKVTSQVFMACLNFFSLCFSILAQLIQKPNSQILTLSPSHGSMNSATVRVCLSYKSGLFIPFNLVNTSYPPPLFSRPGKIIFYDVEKAFARFFYLLTDNIWSRPSQERPARSQNILQENIIFKNWFSKSTLFSRFLDQIKS